LSGGAAGTPVTRPTFSAVRKGFVRAPGVPPPGMTPTKAQQRQQTRRSILVVFVLVLVFVLVILTLAHAGKLELGHPGRRRGDRKWSGLSNHDHQRLGIGLDGSGLDQISRDLVDALHQLAPPFAKPPDLLRCLLLAQLDNDQLRLAAFPLLFVLRGRRW